MNVFGGYRVYLTRRHSDTKRKIIREVSMIDLVPRVFFSIIFFILPILGHGSDLFPVRHNESGELWQ